LPFTKTSEGSSAGSGLRISPAGSRSARTSGRSITGPSTGRDAEGNRVAKGTITSWSCDPSANGFTTAASETDYVLGASGEQVTEVAQDANGTMNWQRTYVYAGGLIATYDPVLNPANPSQTIAQVSFRLTDWLGTMRATTDSSGVWQGGCTSLPFGDGLACQGNIPDQRHFTGKERDAESGNDYFGARYYGSPMGRFLTPDWSAKVEPVPYSKLDDPQTLNLYSYVRSNPMSWVDADGHFFPSPAYAHGMSAEEDCSGGRDEACQKRKGIDPDQQAQQQTTGAITNIPTYSGQSWELAAENTVTVNAYSGGPYVAADTDSYLNTSVGNGECAAFVQTAAGSPRMADMAPGEAVGPNTAKGTAVASFSADGTYTGIRGINHMGTIQSVAANGKSMVLRDQWNIYDKTGKVVGHQDVHDRTIFDRGGGLGGGSNDMSAFRVIMKTGN